LVSAGISPQILFANESLTQAIESVIPEGWDLIETKENEIPWGHYWGISCKGPKGKLLVLRGTVNVEFNWQDIHQNWHKIPLAKEALKIWIMPAGYNDSWKRFFNIHRPRPAVEICLSNSGLIFAQPTHLITSESKFKELLSQAKSTNWIESPHNARKLSWPTWEADLNMAAINF